MLRFDMRAPAMGAPTVELYAAATEMCAWAENHGCLAAVLCEHHGAEDGYLPSPLILASAIAARTERLPLSLILLLPFYDPVRLAEDMAVLDIISKGRASYILALGYRPEEFEHFGVDMRTRGRLADEKLALLRELLSGEAVFDGSPDQHHAAAAYRRRADADVGRRLGRGGAPGGQVRARHARQRECRGHARGLPGSLPPARARAGADLPARPRDPVGLLRRRRRRQGVGRNRPVPSARRARLRRLESGQRLLRGILRRETIEELRDQPDVTPDLQRRGGRETGAGRRGAQPVTAMRRGAPGDRMAVSEARRRGRHVRGVTVTGASAVEVYYDPYDFEIDDDPYPTWKRLRDEAPLYYNEKYNFYALSRYEDVARELPNWDTYRSGRGTTMDIILSGIQLPPGIILFEDPPIHDLHRRLLSRVFTPRRMEAIEPLTRQYCVRALDPLVGSDRFDFIADIGAQIPMRTIGYLLGIPEQSQETIRDNSNQCHHAERRRVRRCARTLFENSYELFAEYIDWRADHPVRRPDDPAAQRGGGGGRRDSAADPHRGADVHQHGRRRRQRDDDAA